MARVIQVEELVDNQKLGWFNFNLFIWSFLAMFGDGYDITALAFAAPELVREWGIEASSLGPAFSASLFGILFGAPLMGFIGDRYGRKPAIIVSCVIYGLGTLAIVWATSLNQIIVLRFLTGIGIGGLMPNAISLNSELSPKRFRAMLTVLMFIGITLGGGTPSVISAWLLPHFGWEVIFLLGGLIPLIVAFCMLFTLPESVKYLALYPEKRKQLLRVARKLRKDLTINDDAEFVITRFDEESKGLGLKQIYSNGLMLITPLLWICFGMVLMTMYLLNSWMPLLFEAKGLPSGQAALASGIFHVGGAIGGLLVSFLMDRFGFLVIAVLFLLGIPTIFILGLEGIPFPLLVFMSTLTGVMVMGVQFGNNAAAGLLYPTHIRSKGVGWALAVGRFGSILGPLIGGALIGLGIPMNQIFLAATLPMLIGGVAALILVRLSYIRFSALQLDDKPASASAPDTG
ncbi:MAG: MFS transporter [Gammaproteobacteria bacterium]